LVEKRPKFILLGYKKEKFIDIDTPRKTGLCKEIITNGTYDR